MQTRLNHSIQHADPTDHPDLVRYCYTDGSIPPARAKITNGLREALTDDAVAALTDGVCLKHFAEALIYASNPKIEQRLSRALCGTLRTDPRKEPMAS